MSTKLKMQNIGAEVSRALRFKSERKEFRAVERANTACNMLKILADEYGS